MLQRPRISPPKTWPRNPVAVSALNVSLSVERASRTKIGRSCGICRCANFVVTTAALREAAQALQLRWKQKAHQNKKEGRCQEVWTQLSVSDVQFVFIEGICLSSGSDSEVVIYLTGGRDYIPQSRNLDMTRVGQICWETKDRSWRHWTAWNIPSGPKES